MDVDVAVAWSLVGALVALLGVAVTAIGLLTRRSNNKNNKNYKGNPGIEAHLVRMETLLEQQVEGQKDVVGKVDDMLLALTDMKATIRFCPTVQDRMRGS